MISTDLLLAEVTGSAGTLAGIAATADLTTTVPTCPDWTLRQLITHVGRAHRWAAAIVATQAAEPIPFREVPDGRLPDDPARQPAWVRDGAARLAEAVTTGSGPVWTHLGPGAPGYWARRMAHETAVHRVDVQSAAGRITPVDPELALDGVDELLELMLAGDWSDVAEEEWAGVDPAAGSGLPVDLVAGGRRWRVELSPAEVVVSGIRGAALSDEPAAATVTADPSDLLLWSWGRLPDSAVGISGEAGAVVAFQDRRRLATQ